MKAEYFLLLLSLFGDSMLKSNFDYEVEPHSEGCEGRVLYRVCYCMSVEAKDLTCIFFLLSLLGNSMFMWIFDSNLIPKADSCAV